MGLSNANWTLTRGATYPIQYQVDNGPILSGLAEANTPTMVRIELLDNVALFKLFRAGRTLRVKGAGQLFEFDLKDSSRVLEVVLQCADNFVQEAKNSANPFTSGQPKAQDIGLMKAEAASVTANLLSAAAIEGFSMAPQIPAELSMFHAVWVAPGLLGAMLVAPGDSVEASSARILAEDARTCKGRFASATLPSQDGTRSLKTICDTDGSGKALTYILFPRPAGGIYEMVVTDDDTAPSSRLPAEAASNKLVEATYTLPTRSKQ